MIQFEGQHEDEEVLFTFRKHPIVLRKGFYAIIIPFLALSVPVIIWPYNLNYFWLSLSGLGIGLVLFFFFWISWYFTIYIVTNQRMRQVTQKGFFSKSVIDLGISKIQNISYNIPGFTASIFDFGTIVVQTYVGDMYLEKIHHPSKIYNELSLVIKKYGGSKDETQNQ